MKTVFIWPNTQKINAANKTTEICHILAMQGVKCLLPEECRSMEIDTCNTDFVTQLIGVRSCDFIVSLGGDGTILRIASMAAKEGKPLLGVNLGHVGFMTELECGELSKLERVFAGKYSIDSRMMLELRILRKGKVLFSQTALNDVTVTKANPFRVIHMNICADGVPVTSFPGDGVVIATPTGSTAYSLSAGGPIIEPTAENIAVTPLCAHNLRAKSFVFAPQREISITATGPDNTNVCVSTDGREGMELRPDDRVLIRKAKENMRLIRVKGKSFYHILKEKLSGEEDLS